MILGHPASPRPVVAEGPRGTLLEVTFEMTCVKVGPTAPQQGLTPSFSFWMISDRGVDEM